MLLKLLGLNNDINRRINNLIRVGTITDVDNDECKARVRIGQLETGFISMATLRAGNAKIWNPPEIGEQVLVFSPCGELNNGVIMGSIFSDANPPPGYSNKHIQNQPEGVEFTAPSFKIVGNFELIGNASITGALTVTGAVETGSSIQAASDIVAGNISLQNHIHPGDSGGSTGKPQ